MAVGSKLGKIFGAIGSGLSFIPGPWSVLGPILGAAGGIAGSVAAKKEREQQEQETAQPSQQAQPPTDNQRPVNEQLPTSQPPAPGPVSGKVFNPQQGATGTYQTQMQSAIANLILKGDLNDLGGV
jgi:uncharacterized protein (DUF2147 family)